MLQRQIMFKQLEELQRQKKLQELNDSRQQNAINQQSLIHNKQASGAQYAPLINGTPVRDPSQMFMFGNTNLVQGFQNQVLNPISLASSHGHGFGSFSQLQVDSISRSSSMSDQFNVPYQQQEQVDKTSEINNPEDFTSLDPLEQKFLFNSDDNNNFGSMFEDTDNSQAFPSLQSGSWSALMQSALDETSSTDNNGMQEEWSGLSFQNPEPSVDNNQPPNIIESRKLPTSWQNNMFQQFPSSHFQFRSDSSHGSNQQSQKETADSSGMSAIVDKSSGFPVQDSNAQTSRHMLELLHKVDKFRDYKHGQQSSYTESTQSKIHKPETTESTQSFGLKLSPLTQRNYFNSSQISQQAATSHLALPVKNQDGQQGSNSKSQPNVWVDIPSLQNHSDISNSRMEAASEAQKDPHLINSQTFDHGRGQDGKFHSGEESFSGCGYSPLNPTYTGSGVKKEEPKLPQVTSMSALTSAYENYKTVLASSATKEDHLIKSPFYPPFQDPSHKNSLFSQMNLPNASQFGTNSVGLNQDSIISKSKKRKFTTFELLPWHKEAKEGSTRLHDPSIAEQEWGHAANRVPEKMKESGGGEVALKKRIILTTQLMQVLFRPTPYKILSDDDAMQTECCEMVTYFAARLALGDACSLVNHPHKISDMSSGKKVIDKGSGDLNLSKIVEDFIERSKKIEDVLLRLENGGSILEIRMESQDLERFSVINRFAKFHSRAQMAAQAQTTTSGGGSGAPKLYPQRYVAASPMPRVVPEGHNCLSL